MILHEEVDCTLNQLIGLEKPPGYTSKHTFLNKSDKLLLLNHKGETMEFPGRTSNEFVIVKTSSVENLKMVITSNGLKKFNPKIDVVFDPKVPI